MFSRAPTRVLALSSQFLGDVLLLQIQDALLFLLEPAEAPSPEGRVLLHQLLDSDLRLEGAVGSPAPVSGRRLAPLLAAGVVVLQSESVEGSGGRGGELRGLGGVT